MKQNNWKKVNLEDVLTMVQYGTSLPTSLNGNVSIIGMKNLSRGVITVDAYSKINMKENEIKKFKLFKGDILLNRTNSYDLVGKVGIFKDESITVVFASYLVRLRCNINVIFPEYLNYWLNSSNIQLMLKRLATRAVSQANINPTIAKKLIPVLLPPLQEQKAIAGILCTWDEAIEKIERLIELKENSFQALLSSSILNKTFKKKKLGTAIYEISQRNQKGVLRVLSVTNHSGFVLPEDRFERRVASQCLDNYKIVCKGQFAYNPSRINVGSIARLDDWDIGVLSPMYVVFGVDEKVIHSDFVFYWLQTKETRRKIRAATQGSVRESVNFTDFANLSIPLPEIKIQQNIIDQLKKFNLEINIIKKISESLTLQKNGIMQKLLTGKWKANFKEAK